MNQTEQHQNKKEPEEKLTRAFVSPYEWFCNRLLCFGRGKKDKLASTFGATSGEIYEKEKRIQK